MTGPLADYFRDVVRAIRSALAELRRRRASRALLAGVTAELALAGNAWLLRRVGAGGATSIELVPRRAVASAVEPREPIRRPVARHDETDHSHFRADGSGQERHQHPVGAELHEHDGLRAVRLVWIVRRWRRL